MKRVGRSLIAALALFSSGWAANQKPWFDNVLEFQLRSGYLYHHYSRVHTAVGRIPLKADEHYIEGRLGISPFPHWSTEFEVLAGDSKQSDFTFQRIAWQLRYRWLDDIVGDPVSLVTGLQARLPFRASRRTLSQPDHSKLDFEAHASLGKEWAEWASWYLRSWVTGAAGIGIRGSAWLRGEATIETQLGRGHQIRLFGRAQSGLGEGQLDLSRPFKDYGDIAYRFVDVGAGYTVPWRFVGSLELDYAYRVWARHFPVGAHSLELVWLYPFSL